MEEKKILILGYTDIGKTQLPTLADNIVESNKEAFERYINVIDPKKINKLNESFLIEEKRYDTEPFYIDPNEHIDNKSKKLITCAKNRKNRKKKTKKTHRKKRK